MGGANTLYKFYNGDLPWNAMLDWLSEDKELYKLVLKAYRYKVIEKLVPKDYREVIHILVLKYY